MTRTDFSTFAFMVLFLLIPINSSAEPPPAEHRVLEQNDAPIMIARYGAHYQESSRYQSSGIKHELNYRNVGDRKIVAVQFGLLSFNIFNEFQDRLGGFVIDDIEVGNMESGAWLASALAESSFYTGVAYVEKVRFEDGEIWSANTEDVLRQLQEIEQDLNVDILER